MAKFILDKVTLSDGNNYDADQGDITNVIVEASLPTIEPNQVTIENGQLVNESYTVNIEMRTKSTSLSGSQSGAILSSAHVSTDGTLPTKSYIRFVGASNSFNISTGAIYLNGYEDYSNGRIETVLTGTLEVISATDGLTS
tara:strand:+ start:205 stop:627 length:423 start_codon:yes stop_codon:yes gene_type:complete